MSSPTSPPATVEVPFAGARLQLVAAPERVADARARIERATADGELAGAFELDPLGAGERYVKGAPLAPGPARRHGRRRLWLGRPAPRVAEYENLSWLRKHAFEAPQPLFAGALWRRGRLVYQLLATRRVQNAEPLAALLDERPPDDAILAALADTTARLHARGFVHRDLFVRNLLVTDTSTGEAPRIVLLDAWRGGVRLQSRGPAFDLACLVEDLGDIVGEACARELLMRYHACLPDDRRPALPRLLATVERTRSALRRRLSRRARRARSR